MMSRSRGEIRPLSTSAGRVNLEKIFAMEFLCCFQFTVPKLCPRYAYLAVLACLPYFRINNLQIQKGMRKIKSPSPHHLFSKT